MLRKRGTVKGRTCSKAALIRRSDKSFPIWKCFYGEPYAIFIATMLDICKPQPIIKASCSSQFAIIARQLYQRHTEQGRKKRRTWIESLDFHVQDKQGAG